MAQDALSLGASPPKSLSPLLLSHATRAYVLCGTLAHDSYTLLSDCDAQHYNVPLCFPRSYRIFGLLVIGHGHAVERRGRERRGGISPASLACPSCGLVVQEETWLSEAARPLRQDYEFDAEEGGEEELFEDDDAVRAARCKISLPEMCENPS